MTNIELAEKISGYLKGSKTKAKKFKDLVAVHFNLLDLSQDMYIEVKEGVLSVMPYEYIDRQAAVTVSSDVIDQIFSGKLAIDDAVAKGLAKVEGDMAKFKALEALIPAAKEEAPKAAAKEEAKPAAVKAEAPKAAPAKSGCKRACGKKSAKK